MFTIHVIGYSTVFLHKTVTVLACKFHKERLNTTKQSKSNNVSYSLENIRTYKEPK